MSINSEILQHWIRYINGKDGQIIDNSNNSIYDRHYEYAVLYKNSYQFVVVIHIQQEPNMDTGPKLNSYTQINILFDRDGDDSIKIFRKSRLIKIIDTFTGKKDTSFVPYYIKAKSEIVKEKILANPLIIQILHELKDIHISIEKNDPLKYPMINVYKKSLVIDTTSIVISEKSIIKINTLALELLAIIDK